MLASLAANLRVQAAAAFQQALTHAPQNALRYALTDAPENALTRALTHVQTAKFDTCNTGRTDMGKRHIEAMHWTPSRSENEQLRLTPPRMPPYSCGYSEVSCFRTLRIFWWSCMSACRLTVCTAAGTRFVQQPYMHKICSLTPCNTKQSCDYSSGECRGRLVYDNVKGLVG